MHSKLGTGFGSRVARLLGRSGAQFTIRPKLGGVQPDFLVTARDGRQIVVETKQWTPQPATLRRAIHQAKLFKNVTNADEAFVVVRGLNKGQPSKGLLTQGELRTLIKDDWGAPPPAKAKKRKKRKSGGGPPPRQAKPKTGGREGYVFAAMPFAPQFDDVYMYAMAYAAKAAGRIIDRVDHDDFEGDIVEEIKRRIKRSDAIIADLSGASPNVLYEVGYAHGLGKTSVLVCGSPLKDLPFDVRNWNVVSYGQGQTHGLRKTLARRLRAALR